MASKIIHDVSAVVATRQALIREKELLATTPGSVGDGVIVTDNQSRVTFLNPEAERLTTLLNKDHTDSAVANRGIESIERNAKAQAQLIEDLVDVSRIISGKVRLDVKPVMVTPIIHSALDAVRPAAEVKSIRLNCTVLVRQPFQQNR